MQSTIASLVVVFIVSPGPMDKLLVRVGGGLNVATRTFGDQARFAAKMTH